MSSSPNPASNDQVIRAQWQLRAHGEAVTDLLAVFGDASDDAIGWDLPVAGGDGSSLTAVVSS